MISNTYFENIRCRIEYNAGESVPIVLLHGYSFTLDVWNEIGLLEEFKSRHIPYLALDMPYGLRSKCTKRNVDSIFNIRLIHNTLENYEFEDKPLLIGASLGGYIALRYALEYSVSGLILIAPVKTSENKFKELWTRDTPILVIYGSRDDVVDIEEMKFFVKKLRNATLKIYEDAKHPAYLTYPHVFKQDVLSFYRIVT